MDEPNVNNLNGVPNFGHGLPEDGEVIAGVTDNAQYVEQNQPVEVAQVEEVIEPAEQPQPVEEDSQQA